MKVLTAAPLPVWKDGMVLQLGKLRYYELIGLGR